jgi:nucleoside-diphosphate-sugar epimerase
VSRVALTGASGFVGRQALAALLAAGHEVHALARTAPVDAARSGATWHEVDLLADPELRSGDLLTAIEPELLVHLAWYAEHGAYWHSPENVRWVEASLALLRGFASAGGRRVVISGTCAEYEWSRDVYAEDAPLDPVTLYGAAKHGLHLVAAAFAEQVGISFAWARLFFLYGPHEDPRRFVPSLATALLRGEQAPMTEGLQRRDFLHVADAGAALAALADSELAGPVNVASGEAVELRELAVRIGELTARPELLQVGALATREGEPAELRADVRRLREELGWQPALTLAQGLEDTVAWWRGRAYGAQDKR